MAEEIITEVTGNVWRIEVEVGDRVEEEDVLIILESMKMEIPIESPVDGVVKEIRVELNQNVLEGAVVAIVEEE
jgi:acetyl-CoA carboxylase biotin carboxyl carrier protein